MLSIFLSTICKSSKVSNYIFQSNCYNDKNLIIFRIFFLIDEFNLFRCTNLILFVIHSDFYKNWFSFMSISHLSQYHMTCFSTYFWILKEKKTVRTFHNILLQICLKLIGTFFNYVPKTFPLLFLFS